MYIALTGSENNKDVYIYHSFRKENGKSSSRIYKKLGKYNTLLEQFDGDRDKMMAWAREQADKETKLYKEATGKISVEFSKAACIPMNERRSFNVGYPCKFRRTDTPLPCNHFIAVPVLFRACDYRRDNAKFLDAFR